jgi:hypothetical protein
MTLQAISVVAGVIICLATVLGLYWEAKRAQFQHGVEILLKFNDAFSSEVMQKARHRAASGLKENRHEEALDVLNFFETIALLVRKKAINEFFVWHSFFEWIHGYCFLTKDYIASCHAQDHTSWEDLVWLHDRLTK